MEVLAVARAAVRRFLVREDYQVAESTSGREALERLRTGAEVGLVVADLKMRDGSGGWLLAQIGYEFPALLQRTLVVSGEADGAAAAHVVARWRCPVLPKPFGATARAIGAALRSGVQVVDEGERLPARHDPFQRREHGGVDQTPHRVVLQRGNRLARIHRVAERAGRGERVDGIAGGEDATTDGDLLAGNPARLAAAVPVLVVVVHEGEHSYIFNSRMAAILLAR